MTIVRAHKRRIRSGFTNVSDYNRINKTSKEKNRMAVCLNCDDYTKQYKDGYGNWMCYSCGVTEVGEHNRNKSKWEQCVYCSGTGKLFVRGGKLKKCTYCNGKGYMKYR